MSGAAIIRLIALALYVVEMFCALRERRKHNYVDAFWHMGWAIIFLHFCFAIVSHKDKKG